jgi:hypothetical protein
MRLGYTKRSIHLSSFRFCRAIEYSSILHLREEELGAQR